MSVHAVATAFTEPQLRAVICRELRPANEVRYRPAAEGGPALVFTPDLTTDEAAALAVLLTAMGEGDAATSDLRTFVAAANALTRAATIQTEMDTAQTALAAATSLAQAKAALAPVAPAVHDLALGVQKILRLLKSQVG